MDAAQAPEPGRRPQTASRRPHAAARPPSCAAPCSEAYNSAQPPSAASQNTGTVPSQSVNPSPQTHVCGHSTPIGCIYLRGKAVQAAALCRESSRAIHYAGRARGIAAARVTFQQYVHAVNSIYRPSLSTAAYRAERACVTPESRVAVCVRDDSAALAGLGRAI